ncbi:MAG: hypothetical protein A2V86_16090 [Deltaproteobacteria bacterium RBG_16_49_23]|nr:MAG: hypothetical protein A2V86_16090 [Deltaproteobacteria bacterium RBG_16_49_23]
MMGEILKQYTEARINERLHLFLQFPDLRRSFQEIDRKDLAFRKEFMSLREECTKKSLIEQACCSKNNFLKSLPTSLWSPTQSCL